MLAFLREAVDFVDSLKAPANIRRRLLVQLPGYIFLTEPHEHDRRLGAGGLALGAESGAVAGAVDDSSAHGPLHGGDGILTEIGHIRITLANCAVQGIILSVRGQEMKDAIKRLFHHREVHLMSIFL